MTLIDKLPPFRHAFLGILPMRSVNESEERRPGLAAGRPRGGLPAESDDDEETPAEGQPAEAPKGAAVRMVYAGSPAAEAGIGPGDRIMRINETDLAGVAAAIAEMNNIAPGNEVALRVLRGDETLDMTLSTARLPTTVPAELPPAVSVETADNVADALPTGETRDLKLPQFEQTCKVYVPPLAESAPRPGLMIWLHAPGESKPDDVIREWRPICDRDGLILVVPTAADVAQWERTELEYLRRLTERAIRQFRPDPRRVVVYGRGGGGGMAYLLALGGRAIFTGVATTNAPLPRQINVPDSDQSVRFAVLSGLPSDAAVALPIAQGLKKLSDAGYPISTLTTSDASGRLTEGEREELARWVDTLDRF